MYMFLLKKLDVINIIKGSLWGSDQRKRGVIFLLQMDLVSGITFTKAVCLMSAKTQDYEKNITAETHQTQSAYLNSARVTPVPSNMYNT